MCLNSGVYLSDLLVRFAVAGFGYCCGLGVGAGLLCGVWCVWFVVDLFVWWLLLLVWFDCLLFVVMLGLQNLVLVC